MLWRIPKGCRRCKACNAPNLSGQRTEESINLILICFSDMSPELLINFSSFFVFQNKEEKKMDAVLKIVQTVNLYLSDYILIILLVGCGLYFSFKTKFVQVRCFGEGWRRVFGNFSLHGGKHEGGMSSFQALATAIAAQVGTGNIVGACGAILVGGPGAIFWMWIIAFFGMSTIYAEAVLAQKTRVVNPDGTVAGGPVYYIKKAFNNGFGKFMAGFFAVAIILALGFMGAMVQSNSIGESCQNAFGIPSWVMGAIIAVICAFIFIGGAHRVAAVAEKIVPIMAILYVLGGFVVLICRIQYIPETFGLIFKYAFNPTAVIGGSIGFAIKQAISQGVKRGLFSNEAGMGSTPHAHAQAKVKSPHEQGVVAMFGVFIDTFVVLTMTALVVISTLYTGDGILSGVMTSSENLAALGVAKRTSRSLHSAAYSARASAVHLSLSACCSSRSRPLSAGTSSAASISSTCSARRQSCRTRSSLSCSSSSARFCPMTSFGS